jgi:hypothetical protein
MISQQNQSSPLEAGDVVGEAAQILCDNAQEEVLITMPPAAVQK